MLIKMKTLQGIRAGEITLAFRRWKRPTVKAGGRLRTAIGELAIEAVDEVTMRGITAEDSRRAGFASRAALIEELRGRQGKLYRVALRFAGADRRIRLRGKTRLSRRDFEEVAEKLCRMDARSPDGAWTARVLKVIEKWPRRRAAELAAKLGMDKDRLKPRVRKLKELGLTESLDVGYRLSPRGHVVLSHLS